ncbi:MAG: 50S ribosomal protein L14 [Patescibacteria group bacterium]
MVQVGTLLNVADNSGAKSLKLIGIPGSSRRRFASLANIVTCVVSGASTTGVVKDHSIVKAVIIRVKKEVRRKDGSYIRFDDNAAVVVDTEGEPRGTRVFGPVARELRDVGYLKIVSLAPEVW